MVNALLSQLFLECVAGLNDRKGCILQMTWSWPDKTGKDVYLQMTWSWPDKTWNILCSYCLQWNTSQSKFRNQYFLFLFAFSILSQLFLIWGCTYMHIHIHIYIYIYIHTHTYICVYVCVYLTSTPFFNINNTKMFFPILMYLLHFLLFVFIQWKTVGSKTTLDPIVFHKTI